MSRHTTTAPLSLSADVLALNPHLKPKDLKAARLGAEHKKGRKDPLVLNGRPVRSETEERAYAFIPSYWPGACHILYEAFSCHLGSTRYTWDFTFQVDDERGGVATYAVEVKPERWDIHPSGRAALRSIKQASSFYGAHYTFVGLLLQVDGSWVVQLFEHGEITEEDRVPCFRV